MIERFSDWERIVHWTTAISFVILACQRHRHSCSANT